MTHAQIIKLANEAAEAANDITTDEFTPSAGDAYDFFRQTECENDDYTDEQAEALWNELALTNADWPVYSAAFHAKLAELREVTK